MNRMPLTDGKVYCRVTRRVRWLPVSAMYRLLAVVPAVAGNTATPHGYARAALVAGLLSACVELTANQWKTTTVLGFRAIRCNSFLSYLEFIRPVTA